MNATLDIGWIVFYLVFSSLIVAAYILVKPAEKSQAFKEGEKAFYNDKTLSESNPYEPETQEFKDFNDGFTSAMLGIW